MTGLLDLSPEHEAILLETLARHVPTGIAVWAFGSRTKGNARRYSDLDLALAGKHPLPAALLSDLADAFDESDLPWKVDLLDWATTSEAFRKIIDEDRVILIDGTAVSQHAASGARSSRAAKSSDHLT